jgi:hypothetical protein
MVLLVLVACRSQPSPPPTTLPAECPPGFAVALGACMPTPLPTPACEKGRARDLDDDRCLSRGETRTLALAGGVQIVAEDDIVACEDAELVASRRSSKLGCLDRESLPPPCPPGLLRGEVACHPVIANGVLDLATWAHAAAAEICRRVARSSSSVSRANASIAIELRARVPDNDMTLAYLSAKSHGTIPIPEGEVARAAEPVSDALRRLSRLTAISNASDVVAYASCIPGPSARKSPRAFASDNVQER